MLPLEADDQIKPRVLGVVDSFHPPNRLVGWAAQPVGSPAHTIEIRIELFGKFIGSCTPSIKREDLRQIGPTALGFDVTVDATLTAADLTTGALVVRATSDGTSYNALNLGEETLCSEDPLIFGLRNHNHSSRGRVYTCHHAVPPRILSTNSFSTMTSGHPGDLCSGLVSDLGGVNIATANEHSEMRHQYYVWKNQPRQLNFVGFEHYRRVFFIQPLADRVLRLYDAELADVAGRLACDHKQVFENVSRRTFDRYLDLREICAADMTLKLAELMSDYDVITQRAYHVRIDKQWAETHDPIQWDLLVKAVSSTDFYRSRPVDFDFSHYGTSLCNMYIMRIEIFLDYMEFWSQSISYIEERVEMQDRLLGYFAERLASIYLNSRRRRSVYFATLGLPFLSPLSSPM